MSIKSLVDTPAKKIALATFLTTNLCMVLIPIAGPFIGASLGYRTGQIAAGVATAFVINEVLLFGSVAVLGKPLVGLIKGKVKRWLI